MFDRQSLKRELEAKLEEDEILIWSDYPKQSFQILFEDLLIIPFLIIVILISASLLFQIILNISTNIFIIIFSISTLTTSIALIYSRYIQKIILQKKSIYGLTSKRVVIIVNNKANSLNLSDIKEISFVEHPFNYKYGSIIFGEPESIFGSSNLSPFEFKKIIIGYRGGLNLKRDDFVFDFITDTKKIYHLIKSKINK